MKKILVTFFVVWIFVYTTDSQPNNYNHEFDTFLEHFSDTCFPLNTLYMDRIGWNSYIKNHSMKISDSLVQKYIVNKASDMYYDNVTYDETGRSYRSKEKYWYFYLFKINTGNLFLLFYQRTNDDTTWTCLSTYTKEGIKRQDFIVGYISDNKSRKSIVDGDSLITCDVERLMNGYTKSFSLKGSDTIWTGGLMLKPSAKYKSLITISRYQFDCTKDSFVFITREVYNGIGSNFEYFYDNRKKLPPDDPFVLK